MENFLALGPLFMAGLATGLTVAMPFGPFGQLAARLKAEKKRRAAHELIYTTVVVDVICAAIVLVFLNFIPAKFGLAHPVVWGLVGLAIVVLGLEIWRSAHALPIGKLPFGFKRTWQFGLVYSLFYPGSVLIFIATFGVMHGEGLFATGWDKAACWLGVVTGMVLAWVVWLALVHHLKKRISSGVLRLIFTRGLAATFIFTGGALIWGGGTIQWLAEHL
jgi:threonine/homoserine/homoserine lactone efflux protein